MVKLLLRDDEVEYCSGCPDLEFGYNILGGKIPQVPLIIENTGSSLQFIQSYGGRGKSGLNSFRGKFHCSLFQCDQHYSLNKEVLLMEPISRTTLNTKGLVAAGRRWLPPVPANRELVESSNSK